jgi:hypothetical protein
VIYAPPPVVYTPAPVVYQPVYQSVYRMPPGHAKHWKKHGHQHGSHRGHRHDRHDRDDD